VSGVGRALRERFPDCLVVAVEPESCATISRGERGPSKIQGIAAGFVPKNYDPQVPQTVRTIADRRAYETKRDLARREGLLVGISAGANVAIALDVAAELGPNKTVVTVLCDTGERYFSLDEYFAEEPS
jgi:cysteine synthase A